MAQSTSSSRNGQAQTCQCLGKCPFELSRRSSYIGLGTKRGSARAVLLTRVATGLSSSVESNQRAGDSLSEWVRPRLSPSRSPSESPLSAVSTRPSAPISRGIIWRGAQGAAVGARVLPAQLPGPTVGTDRRDAAGSDGRHVRRRTAGYPRSPTTHERGLQLNKPIGLRG